MVKTLLHYLAKHLENTDSELLDFMREMPRVELAARVCIPALFASIKELRRGIEAVKYELTEMAKLDAVDLNDRFVSVMQSFSARADMRVSGLEYQAAVAEKSVNDLIAYFGDDPNDRADAPEEFFAVFASFSAALHKAQRENEAAERQVRQREAYAQRSALLKAERAKAAEVSEFASGSPQNISAASLPATSFADLRETLLRSVEATSPTHNPTQLSSESYGQDAMPQDAVISSMGASTESITQSEFGDSRETGSELGTESKLGTQVLFTPTHVELAQDTPHRGEDEIRPLPSATGGLDATARLMKAGSLLRARVTLRRAMNSVRRPSGDANMEDESNGVISNPLNAKETDDDIAIARAIAAAEEFRVQLGATELPDVTTDELGNVGDDPVVDEREKNENEPADLSEPAFLIPVEGPPDHADHNGIAIVTQADADQQKALGPTAQTQTDGRQPNELDLTLQADVDSVHKTS